MVKSKFSVPPHILIIIMLSSGVGERLGSKAPVEGIALILAVDRILDMFRTTINVYGDTCAAVIIAKSEGEKLKI